MCQAVSHKDKTLHTGSGYSRRIFGFDFIFLLLNTWCRTFTKTESRNWMCMKDGDSGKILWLNQNSDFSKSNIEHEARIPKKILKVCRGRCRVTDLFYHTPFNII